MNSNVCSLGSSAHQGGRLDAQTQHLQPAVHLNRSMKDEQRTSSSMGQAHAS